ncbi:hypothetical protein LZ023_40765 (plasmid) [Pseudomonas silvicola]|nr:hypothetical protein LZ023_41040 [Pseudomonas silvicola]WAH62268.1 hypothetical protein LZ023_40765 [Pseudomonas silvicola]
MTQESAPRVEEKPSTYKKKMQTWLAVAFGGVFALLVVLTLFNVYMKATGRRAPPPAPPEAKATQPAESKDPQDQFKQLMANRKPSAAAQDGKPQATTRAGLEQSLQGLLPGEKQAGQGKGIEEDEETKAVRKWKASEQIRALKASQGSWKFSMGNKSTSTGAGVRTAAAAPAAPVLAGATASGAGEQAPAGGDMTAQINYLNRPFTEGASLEERRKEVQARIVEAQKLRRTLAASGAAGVAQATAGRPPMSDSAAATRAELAKVNQGFSKPPADVVGYTKDNAYNADIAGKIKVPPGTEIRTTLMKKSISDYMGSSLKAIVSNDVYDTTRQYVIFPKGTEINIKNIRFKGPNAVLSNRSAFTVREAVLPNGNKVDFTASAADTEGVGAIEGDTNYHFWAQFFGVAAYALVGSQTSYSGSGEDDDTYAGTVGQNARDQMSPLVSKYLDVVPTVTLEPGTSFQIVIEKEMYVEPWSDLYAKYVD